MHLMFYIVQNLNERKSCTISITDCIKCVDLISLFKDYTFIRVLNNNSYKWSRFLIKKRFLLKSDQNIDKFVTLLEYRQNFDYEVEMNHIV